MAAAPELAPFAGRVVLRQVIWPFTALCAFLFAWGLLSALDAFVRACFGTAEGKVGWIPYLGRVLSSGLASIEHKISSILGKWVSYFEVQAGIRWHGLARVVTQIAADTEAAAIMNWTIVSKLLQYIKAWQVHMLLKGVHAIGKVITQRTTIVEHKVIRVEKIVGTKANSVVVHRVGALAGEIEHVIEWDIPHLRARDRAISDSLGRLWKRVNAERKTIAFAAFTGLLVAALAKLGLGWVRCSNVKKLGKRACGMDASQIEGLLLDTIAIVGTVSLVEFIRDAQAIEAVALDALGGFIREFPKV